VHRRSWFFPKVLLVRFQPRPHRNPRAHRNELTCCVANEPFPKFYCRVHNFCSSVLSSLPIALSLPITCFIPSPMKSEHCQTSQNGMRRFVPGLRPVDTPSPLSVDL
jgi:hypothetical protein